jgi:hypothetical protein
MGSAGRSATAQYEVAGVEARRRRLVSGSLLGLAAMVAFAVVFGLVPPWTGFVAVAAGLAGWLFRPDADPERWLRGAAGEEATAALLDRLPRRKWVVRHDLRLPGSRANVDHLVIGPTGVWVIDSKAYRAHLSVHRGQVWAGEYAVDVGPVAWEAERVSRMLQVSAIPIVAVHGFGLRRRGKRSARVRIIPAARLVRRLRRGRRVLGRASVAALGARADAVWPGL